jgi:hypothetical protein
MTLVTVKRWDGIVGARSTATITWQQALPTPVRYSTFSIETTLHTASLFRGAARNMSSTLQAERRN